MEASKMYRVVIDSETLEIPTEYFRSKKLALAHVLGIKNNVENDPNYTCGGYASIKILLIAPNNYSEIYYCNRDN